MSGSGYFRWGQDEWGEKWGVPPGISVLSGGGSPLVQSSKTGLFNKEVSASGTPVVVPVSVRLFSVSLPSSGHLQALSRKLGFGAFVVEGNGRVGLSVIPQKTGALSVIGGGSFGLRGAKGVDVSALVSVGGEIEFDYLSIREVLSGVLGGGSLESFGERVSIVVASVFGGGIVVVEARKLSLLDVAVTGEGLLSSYGIKKIVSILGWSSEGSISVVTRGPQWGLLKPRGLKEGSTKPHAFVWEKVDPHPVKEWDGRDPH